MDDKYTLNSHQPLSCVGICSRACARQNKQVPTTKAASQKEDGQVQATLEDPLMMNKYSSDI